MSREISKELLDILKTAGYEVETDKDVAEIMRDKEKFFKRCLKEEKVPYELGKDKFKKIGFNMNVLDGAELGEFWQVVSDDNGMEYFVPIYEASSEEVSACDKKDKKKKSEEGEKEEDES